MYYIISDDITIIEKIDYCLAEKGIKYCNITFFFPYRKGNDWCTIQKYKEKSEEAELIIAIEKKGIREKLIEYLSENLVDTTRTFDFIKVRDSLIPFNNIDRKMTSKKGSRLDGIILGISHGQVGIKADCFEPEYNYVNLAFESQDLFYNYQTLLYLAKNYPAEVVSANHIVFDMFDYSFFNYDISLARHALIYYDKAGCYLGPHHFDENKAYEFGFDIIEESTENKHTYNITDEEYLVWNTLFDNYYEIEDYESFGDKPILSICSQEQIDKFRYGDIVYNTFVDTLEENHIIFEQILELIYAINPNMQIHLVLLPRNIEIEEKEKENEYIQTWKEYFYSELEKYNLKYSFDFWDLKGDNDLNLSMDDYFDAAHLNLFGATKVTYALKNAIYGDAD